MHWIDVTDDPRLEMDQKASFYPQSQPQAHLVFGMDPHLGQASCCLRSQSIESGTQ